MLTHAVSGVLPSVASAGDSKGAGNHPVFPPKPRLLERVRAGGDHGPTGRTE